MKVIEADIETKGYGILPAALAPYAPYIWGALIGAGAYAAYQYFKSPESAYEACLRERLKAGMTPEQARTACAPIIERPLVPSWVWPALALVLVGAFIWKRL
jgi:hypothetical protein